MLCYLVFVLLLPSTLSEEAGLVVNQPLALVDKFKQGIKFSPANFGFLAYGHGGVISGTLWNGTLQDGNVTLSDACTPLPATPPHVILILNRGGCTFVAKVREAQKAGAKAVIVVDHANEFPLPLMADDHTGGDVSIPSVLISKKDGEAVTDVMRTGELVGVTMTWNRPRPNTQVKWDLWTSSDDQATVDFKKQIALVSLSLGSDAVFTPHYFFQQGGYYGCVSTNISGMCKDQCTNDARYCAFDLDTPGRLKGLDGQRIVSENLRQMCVFKVTNVTHGSQEGAAIWFRYVNQFHTSCFSASLWQTSCAESVMTKLSISVSDVNQCIQTSGGSAAKGGLNSMIEQEIVLRSSQNYFENPTILVNNVIYYGSLVCSDPIDVTTCGLLNMICSSYLEGSAPRACVSSSCPLGQVKDPCGVCGGDGAKDVCGSCISKHSPSFNKSCVGCDGVPFSLKVTDDCGVCDFPSGDSRRTSKECVNSMGTQAAAESGGFSHVALFLIVSVIIMITGVGVWWCMRRREREMKNDIDRLLKNYLPLDAIELG